MATPKSEPFSLGLRGRLLLLAAVAGVFAGSKALVAAGWTVEQIAALSPLSCPVLALTGHPCPSCGLTRSVIAAFSMQWQTSLEYHPLGVVIALLGSAAAVTWALWPGVLRRVPVVNQRVVGALVAVYAVWGFLLR